MNKHEYYSTGEFMRLAHITKKTVRYYDERNILKPAMVSSTGARFYTDAELARLQQILLLKYLGFSLDDIKELTIKDADRHFITDSLKLQQRLVEDRIEQLQIVAQTLCETTAALDENKSVDWSHMLNLIHEMGLEKSLKNQYQNASNISARINLHKKYSHNKIGWFPWLYDMCNITSDQSILELGCGDGSFWVNNLVKLPSHVNIVLSDISEGMLRDARRALSIGSAEDFFVYDAFDCQCIPYKDNTFDTVVANYVLFYCDDIEKAVSEAYRILKPGGTFICSTYGTGHMKEISKLVTEFDDRIVLSAVNLFERFGKENGECVLDKCFSEVNWYSYDDFLLVDEPESLISYVMSCHGNQNQYILEHYKEFRSFVKKQTEQGFYITKDAGVFKCKK